MCRLCMDMCASMTENIVVGTSECVYMSGILVCALGPCLCMRASTLMHAQLLSVFSRHVCLSVHIWTHRGTFGVCVCMCLMQM